VLGIGHLGCYMAKKKTTFKTDVKNATATALRTPALPSPRLKSGISAKSMERAKSVFSKFTLSRFAGKEAPPHYVTRTRSLPDVHKHIISKAIDMFESSPTNRAMTIALPEADMKKLLPSFDSAAGTVQLADVLQLVEPRIRGREFFATGNPTLNRLSVEASAQQIFNAFKKDVTK